MRWIWNWLINHYEQCPAERHRGKGFVDYCQRRIGHPGLHITFADKEFE